MVRYRDLVSDTICSPITAPGYSGVAVIRISGDHALRLTNKFSSKDLSQAKSHTSYLINFKAKDSEPIDQVLVTFFEKDKSFTGDETIEISCHGNPLIINKISETFLNEGCRPAEKGEFSFRAFYNGKIDLVQAESIHQLVTTKTRFGSEAFLTQLQGELSEQFVFLQETIVECLAHLEASIDFVEEDIETDQLRIVDSKLLQCLEKAHFLVNSYDTGKTLSESFKILFLGKTNVGKSSLFNQLVREDRAIVTDIPGTTRDMISNSQFIGNHQVEIFDSAGLRETSDVIEKVGIKKGLNFSKNADLNLYILELNNLEESLYLKDLDPERTYLIFNKADQVDIDKREKVIKKYLVDNNLEHFQERSWVVSALTGESVDDLTELLEKHLSSQQGDSEGGIITQSRHFNHLVELVSFLNQAKLLISHEESPDIISQELKLALSEVHALLGKEYNDEILDKIFSDFCIGK